MNDVIGIAWYKDELTYRRALKIFTDSQNMPATYEDWKVLVGRQCEEIKGSGNSALRVDIDPETFIDWCTKRGFQANSQGRIAFVNHAELEYRKTGKETVIE
ncbi:MAG: putative cytosolic protein [Deltaproteobacteria bacterium]|nr:putative cytosolic protein [Deltaproteobacteria bacterium]